MPHSAPHPAPTASETLPPAPTWRPTRFRFGGDHPGTPSEPRNLPPVGTEVWAAVAGSWRAAVVRSLGPLGFGITVEYRDSDGGTRLALLGPFRVRLPEGT
jgi:hypothetical protein